MVTLKEALPFLVLELESELLHVGRADMVAQLREVTIERWSYDEHADATYLHLRSPRAPDSARNAGAGEPPGKTVSASADLGINLNTDDEGRLTGMDILGGRAIVAQLEEYNS